MPRPENLRLRLQLISQFEQLAERLAHGDETAVEEAKDRLFAIATVADCDTMSQVFRALAKVLTDMQKTIDDGGFQF